MRLSGTALFVSGLLTTYVAGLTLLAVLIGMQGTALVSAVLPVVASFVAYQLIPSRGQPDRLPRPAVRADGP